MVTSRINGATPLQPLTELNRTLIHMQATTESTALDVGTVHIRNSLITTLPVGYIADWTLERDDYSLVFDLM